MSEAAAVYLRMKELFTGTPSRSRRAKRAADDPTASRPFGAGRDPLGLGDVVDALATQLGWTGALAKSDLLERWEELAGAETARHAIPDQITDGVLVVRCESTAWATQLRMMRSELLARIGERFPGRRSSRSDSRGRTPPPGNAVPGRFQGAVRAILTADCTKEVARAKKTRQRGDSGQFDSPRLVEWRVTVECGQEPNFI